MSSYLKTAKEHKKKIEHYHKHAGANGYSQANPLYLDLLDMMRSKNNKNDVIEIRCIIEECAPMIEDMKRLEEEQKERSK